MERNSTLHPIIACPLSMMSEASVAECHSPCMSVYSIEVQEARRKRKEINSLFIIVLHIPLLQLLPNLLQITQLLFLMKA